MATEHWQRVKAIFQAALEQAAADRKGFLNGACMGDPSLRKEVESLLTSHEQEDSALEKPPLELIPSTGPDTDDIETFARADGDEPRQQIGP